MARFDATLWNTGLSAGLLGLALAALCAWFLGTREKDARDVLIAACSVRIGAVLVHHFLLPLPDSSVDAVTYEGVAWEWASAGWEASAANFPAISSYFYSWLMSLFYLVCGRSPMLLESISVAIGTANVLLIYRLAKLLWGDKAAIRAGWTAAFFPSLILYSSLVVREPFIVFFFTLAMIMVVQWRQQTQWKFFACAQLSLSASSFFHGGMFVGIAALSTLGIFTALRGLKYNRHAALARSRFGQYMVVVSVNLILLVWLFYTNPYVPKIGHVRSLVDPHSAIAVIDDRMTKSLNSSGEAGATYPNWTVPSVPADLSWAVPVRIAYFLYAPYPWDVHSIRQLSGMLDSLLYVVITVVLATQRRVLFHSRGSLAVFFIVACFVLFFAVGTSNFGTGIRHRAKFASVLIAFSAGFRMRDFLRKD